MMCIDNSAFPVNHHNKTQIGSDGRSPYFYYVNNIDKVNFSVFGLLSFICGMPSIYVVNLMGELYATEIALPFLTTILVFIDKNRRALINTKFWLFIISLFILTIGYYISDLAAGASAANYLRGWGRNAILLSDLICLSILAGTDKRYIFWYFFGFAVGSIVLLQLTGIPFTNYYWKLSYGSPVLLIILAIGYFVPQSINLIFLLLIGIFSFQLDARSFGSICILLAVILWIRRANPVSLKIRLTSVVNIIVAASFAVIIVLYIMIRTNEDYSARRDISTLGRTVSLRVALIAIRDSPIIGYGSWGEGTKEYAAMLYKETKKEYLRLGQSNIHKGNTFLAHSQLLQSWMEGGILAAQFFIFYGYQILSTLKYIIINRRYDYISTLYCFFLIGSFWDLFMSPYNGIHRLNIAIAISIICAVSVEKTIERKINVASNETLSF